MPKHATILSMLPYHTAATNFFRVSKTKQKNSGLWQITASFQSQCCYKLEWKVLGTGEEGRCGEFVRWGDGIVPKVLFLLALWSRGTGSLGIHPPGLGKSTGRADLLLCYKSHDMLHSTPEIQLWNEKKKGCFCRDWPLSRCLGPFLELALKIEQDVQKPSPECAKWLKASGEDKGSVGRTEARKPTPFLCQMREAFCP